MKRMLARVTVALMLTPLCGLTGSCTREGTAADEAAGALEDQVTALPEGEKTMRPTAVAGMFYVAHPATLKEQVRGFLDKAEVPELSGDVVAVMVPHAGYEFSGGVAAHSYKVLRGKPLSTVVIMGNTHSAHFSGAALSPDDVWETPLGPVEVDVETVDQLAALDDPFVKSRDAHQGSFGRAEHNLEVQVPFVKTVLPDAKIVPILLGAVSKGDCEKIAEALAPIIERPDVVLVTSSDMSHFPTYEDANRCDKATLDAIVTLDPDRILASDGKLMSKGTGNLQCTLCGLEAVVTTVMVANKLGVTEATVLEYANSGDSPRGDHGRCVGYGAVVFTAPKRAEEAASADADDVPLTDDEKRLLLRIARKTLEGHLGKRELPPLDPGNSKALARVTACFVTLKERGRLRGCIGELEPRQPLIEAVASRAIAAAEHDPRFRPVTADELPRIAIDISAMSPLRRVDSYQEIVVGKHGVVVKQGGRSGVFLPQVAPEQGWDRDTMLTVLCTEKAGLAADAWKKGAELWVFTANVFNEEEFGLAPPDSLKKQ